MTTYRGNGDSFSMVGSQDGSGGLSALVAIFAMLIAFSVFVAFLLAFHVYVKCYLRNQARQRGGEQQPPSQAQQSNSELDPAVIASLPIFIFKQWDDRNRGNPDPIECAICLSVLKQEDMARLLPNCKHIFHAECIGKWLISGRVTCPICRTEVTPFQQFVLMPPEPPAQAHLGCAELLV